MAPPASRRSSQSRKAQYGVFTGYVLAIAGALVGAALLALSLVRPASFEAPRGAAREVTRPAGEGAAAVRTGSQGLFAAIAGYWDAGTKNARLEREAGIARIRLAEAAAVAQENARLKGILGLTEAPVKPVAVARLIGSTASSTRRIGYLGAGSSDGLVPGMPVRSERGVVGRILEVSPHTARVLLLTDSQSVLPVRLARANVAAFAEGRGDGLIQIRLINLGINPLRKGDLLVTSGAGGYYQPGIAVAVVDHTVDDGAVARMVSDPAATDFVTVEPIWQAALVKAVAQPPEKPLTE